MGLTTSVIAAIPTTIGTAEAVSAQKKQDEADKRSAKFNLIVTLLDAVDYSVVLRDGFLYLQEKKNSRSEQTRGHPFLGYFFTHPGASIDADDREPTEGLVSTISSGTPMLNWIFVDDETGAIRHGTRTESLGHMVGPWGWTEDEQNLILDDDEGFVVFWQAGEWQVFFDIEGDGSGMPRNTKFEEVSLQRKLLCGYGSQLIKDSDRDRK